MPSTKQGGRQSRRMTSARHPWRRGLVLEEKKVMMVLIADENRTMMYPSTMDAFTREWWDMRRGEVMERRRQARLHGGGGGAGAGGGGGGGDGNVSFA
jgi:hypothetical protein